MLTADGVHRQPLISHHRHRVRQQWHHSIWQDMQWHHHMLYLIQSTQHHDICPGIHMTILTG